MPATKENTWYKDAIIYELHIKAFCDSNGDGIGDFQGLISKLDYLQELGITAIWLLPFYPSPLKDDGYDIADYYKVNPSYGTIEDFKQLLDEAHKRDLKVITELVVNHTSDQHPWFQRARKAPAGSTERNYYVWSDDPQKYSDVRIIFQDFETSNWTWDEQAGQYYWHRFFHHQPDLNYDSEEVQREIFRVLDYWCAMGVDGFRLDAVPYLYEREGTNGENLPETHAFLKKLRAHMDKHFPSTLFLAEANMWPEDSASYFGNGDECHMNYHFPVMPRIFMSLQMEDRHPLTDIFEQTPAIPDTCQWAIFLRNHDELTLEMVTDEERDYMYRTYVKDPKARINLGIRHRLAPLMDNNRKKIELLNYLLFSLPGTPVLYYGDEIGMGDNFYLGDRDGVRTPMQWTASRNAGFSNANPQQLYLPLIQDPEYHYEIVNVESQTRNSSSLMWWTKRLIHTRKNHEAFGRGDMHFLGSENSKIMAFTRTFNDETILVVANLSRFVQPVHLALQKYAGCTPVEVLSKNTFPPIAADAPYFFSIGAHDCHWFVLQQEGEEAAHVRLPVSEIGSWEEFTNSASLDHLANYVLPRYLAKVRWFGGKGRTIHQLRVIDHAELGAANEKVFILLIEVQYKSGMPEIYQLPVALALGDAAPEFLSGSAPALISEIRVGGRKAILYDAVFSPSYQRELFKSMAEKRKARMDGSAIICDGDDKVADFFNIHSKVDSKVLGAEQSNTSIVFGDAYFLKVYRKVSQATNPDLELTRFLTQNGFSHVPAYAGSVQWQRGAGETMVLAMMQEFNESNGDAWQYMMEHLRKYNEAALTETMSGNAGAGAHGLADGIAEEKVQLLGTLTGEMHKVLASDTSSPDFKPEAFSLHYQRSLYSSFQSLTRSAFQQLEKSVETLPEDVKKIAREVLGLRSNILEQFKKVYLKKLDAVKMRVHGDYHLGQVLVSGMDMVIVDFEGEPARSYSERRLKRSPLKDVAGMIRSFHYAAFGSLLLDDQLTKTERTSLFSYAGQWYERMKEVYLDAYLQTVNGAALVPTDDEEFDVLLNVFLLEKAIYELSYELNSRPTWVIIPLLGILSIMKSNGGIDEHKEKR